MVDVEIDDGGAFHPMLLACMLRAGRHTVEDAKTHGDRLFGMVSWGTYGAEGVIGLFTDNSVNG